ncbi:MAG: hypothetical protein AB7K09_16705 [Planctomycetota bacterium]
MLWLPACGRGPAATDNGNGSGNEAGETPAPVDPWPATRIADEVARLDAMRGKLEFDDERTAGVTAIAQDGSIPLRVRFAAVQVLEPYLRSDDELDGFAPADLARIANAGAADEREYATTLMEVVLGEAEPPIEYDENHRRIDETELNVPAAVVDAAAAGLDSWLPFLVARVADRCGGDSLLALLADRAPAERLREVAATFNPEQAKRVVLLHRCATEPTVRGDTDIIRSTVQVDPIRRLCETMSQAWVPAANALLSKGDTESVKSGLEWSWRVCGDRSGLAPGLTAALSTSEFLVWHAVAVLLREAQPALNPAAIDALIDGIDSPIRTGASDRGDRVFRSSDLLHDGVCTVDQVKRLWELNLLPSASPTDRRQLAWALAGQGEVAVGLLLPELDSADPLRVHAAWDALGPNPAAPLTERAIKLLNDEARDPGCVSGAISVLQRVTTNQPGLVELLTRLITGEAVKDITGDQERFLLQAAVRLGEAGHPCLLAAVRARITLFDEIRHLPQPMLAAEAIAQLRQALQSTPPLADGAHVYPCRLLAMCGEHAAPALDLLMQAFELDNRAPVFGALVAIGPPAAEPLVAWLPHGGWHNEDDHQRLTRRSETAIRMLEALALDGVNVWPAVFAAFKHDDRTARYGACAVIVRVAESDKSKLPADIRERLKPMADDPDESTSRAAKRALAALGE